MLSIKYDIKKNLMTNEIITTYRRLSMNEGIPSNWEECVNCQFWTGPRRISEFRDQVFYEGGYVEGECVGGGWDKYQKGARDSCKDFVKWSVIKD
jgi:hypothetical protein